MAKLKPQSVPSSYPTSIQHDGIDVSKSHDCPVGKRLQDHREWHDSETMLPCDKPDYAED